MLSGTILAGLATLALAVFSLLGRRAVDMWDKGKYQEVASSVFWAMLPVACWMLWLSSGDTSMLHRNLLLGAIGAIIGAAGLIWIGYAFQGTTKAHTMNEASPPKEPVNIAGNNNVVSVGQKGGVTAGVYVNQVHQPTLKLLDQHDAINADGSHTTTFEVEVVSQVTPAFLAVDIAAEDIIEIIIRPPSVGGISIMSLKNVQRSSIHYHAELSSPRGRYTITVQTGSQTPVKLDYQF